MQPLIEEIQNYLSYCVCVHKLYRNTLCVLIRLSNFHGLHFSPQDLIVMKDGLDILLPKVSLTINFTTTHGLLDYSLLGCTLH